MEWDIYKIHAIFNKQGHYWKNGNAFFLFDDLWVCEELYLNYWGLYWNKALDISYSSKGQNKKWETFEEGMVNWNN